MLTFEPVLFRGENNVLGSVYVASKNQTIIYNSSDLLCTDVVVCPNRLLNCTTVDFGRFSSKRDVLSAGIKGKIKQTGLCLSV